MRDEKSKKEFKMTELLIAVLAMQIVISVIMSVMILYGTNIRDRAWQLPIIGRLFR